VTFKITKCESAQNIIMDSKEVEAQNRKLFHRIRCNIGDDYIRNSNILFLKH